MAKFKVLEKSFINNAIVEAGEVVEYDGDPGPNLELVKEPAKGKGKTAAADKPDGDASADQA